MSVRPATHAGSWYSANNASLASQMERFISKAQNNLKKSHGGPHVPGARVLIGPHAGYTYSGTQLAETYEAWDTTGVKRVFILGPSHHVYFSSTAKVSKFDSYQTPFGNLDVDTKVCSELVDKGAFSYMTEEEDENEHSFEMHAPFIRYKTKDLPHGSPKIVPIMISAMNERLYNKIVKALEPYFADKSNTFAVSSDFCHWGARFGYTKYLQKIPDSEGITSQSLVSLKSSSQLVQSIPIHRSIEILDKEAMKIASKGTHTDWNRYIDETQNTICGQKPISVVLRLLNNSGAHHGFSWVCYSQSDDVTSPTESSVSYASGYVALPITTQ